MATTDVNKRGAAGRRRSGVAAVLAASGVVAALPAAAEFEAQVLVGATHSDNVTLAEDSEQSELVYRVEPSFDMSYETSWLTADAHYFLQAFRYRDLEETEVFQAYDASVRAALVPDTLFLEVGGNRTQSILDPERGIPQGNLAISSNRVDRDEYYAAPSFQLGLGQTVRTTGEYRYSWVEYGDTDQALDEPGHELAEGTFSIDNYRQNSGLAWALRYQWARTEYDNALTPWEHQEAVAELGFWIGGGTRLFAAGGLESAWDMPLDPALEDELWEVGISQKVGDSFTAEFAAGERSFGASVRGMLDYRFRRGRTSLSYTETPTTEGNNRFRRSTTDEPNLPDDLLVRVGSAERFIAKRLEWATNWQRQRTDFAIVLFNVERTDRSSPDGTPLGDESQVGAMVYTAFRIGPRTELTLRGSWSERELRSDDTSELKRGTAGIRYRIGPRTSVSLEYDYAADESESPTFTGGYVANYVSLFFTRTLF